MLMELGMSDEELSVQDIGATVYMLLWVVSAGTVLINKIISGDWS